MSSAVIDKPANSLASGVASSPAPMVPAPGIPIRFGASLAANLLRAAGSIVTGLVIARSLGASGYGDLGFLLSSLTAVGGLVDNGTSSAFYTFIARRKRGWSFFLYYWAWLTIQFVATGLVVSFLLPDRVGRWLWVGNNPRTVLLAWASSFLMNQGWGMLSQLGEATRRTVFVQVVAILQTLLHLALVSLAVLTNCLTVGLVLWFLLIEHAVLVFGFTPKLIRQNIGADREESLGPVVDEFWAYCRPLLAYTWLGFLYSFADRWLLQHYGGSEQQGFFSIAQQFANVSLIATTSILRVFWKEIAEARQTGNEARVRRLFDTVTRGFYVVVAWTSCLLIPHCRAILQSTVGRDFSGAWLPLTLMLLTPIHQAQSQIQMTFLYASSETRTLSRIGMWTMALSLPLAYLLLAPVPPLGLGLHLNAIGLALKTLIANVAVANVQAWAIAKKQRWSYSYGYQIIILGVFLALALLTRQGAAAFLPGSQTAIVSLPTMASVIAYVMLSIAAARLIAKLAGLPLEQLRELSRGWLRRPLGPTTPA